MVLIFSFNFSGSVGVDKAVTSGSLVGQAAEADQP